MAKTSYLDIPTNLTNLFKKTLQSGDRFTFPRVYVKRQFLSRTRKKNITNKSLLPQIAILWQALTEQDKTAWNIAGVACNTTGWKIFFNDTSLRIKNSLQGLSTPSELHQGKCGKIIIESPANEIRLAQLHPNSYYVFKKVRGTRSQYEPKKVAEGFYLPLEIAISYKSNLVASGGTPQAKFYCNVESHYQGKILNNILSIDIELQTDWKRKTNILTKVVGVARSYIAYIEIKNATGILYFDNIEIKHGGINWVRDPYCNNIKQNFTKAYAQIPKHWVADIIPNGAYYDSMFPEVDN